MKGMKMNPVQIQIEMFDEKIHSIEEITELLHESYKVHLENGLQFWATTQTEEYTLQRFKKGIGIIVKNPNGIIGTITYYDSCDDNDCDWYKNAHICRFGQFAVKPNLQKQGIGKLLINEVQKIAKTKHKNELSLDTSEKALSLINYYQKNGFRHIGYMQWHGVNYRSVIMSKII